MRILTNAWLNLIWRCCEHLQINSKKALPAMGAFFIFLTLFYSTAVVAQIPCPPNVMRYTVADAVPDPTVNTTPIPLGIWLDGVFCSGGQTTWTFDPGTYLDVFLDGTGAHLHGTATVANDPCGLYQGTTWVVNVMLDTPAAWMNSVIEPHLELFSGNQPASITNDWEYFVINSSSTISNGNNVINLTHYPGTYQYAFQMGWTASGKNLDYGFSAWFTYDFNGVTGNGDIIGVLDSLCEGPELQIPPCPIPANVTRYEVFDAVPDPTVNTTPISLGIWMDGVFCDNAQAVWTWNPETYLDVQNDGSSAHLHGTATVVSDPCGIYTGTSWVVDIHLTEPAAWMSIQPHLELFSGNQPASITNDWVYFVIENTSTISLGNQVIDLTHYPATYQYAFQMGWTASGKNLDFGFSAWFEYEFNGRTGNGDIIANLDSVICPTVPEFQDPCPVPADVTRYEVSNATVDPAVNAATHGPLGIWMDGVFCPNAWAIWTWNPGTFLDVALDGSTAHLHGTATVVTDPCGLYAGTTWNVDIHLTEPAAWMSVEPHLELFSGNQPASITDDWIYFVIENTSMIYTATDTITLSHYPATYQYAFQIGWTASGKNLDFGSAAWFQYDFNGVTGLGDIIANLDTVVCPPPPPNVPCPPGTVIPCVINAPAMMPECGSTGNTLSATTDGDTYLWEISSADNSWIITAGQGTSEITYTAGTPGSMATITLTTSFSALNDCIDVCTLVLTCDEPVQPQVGFCTYTQGFYGNAGGKKCGETTTQILNDLLSSGPIVLGSGANTITFGTGDAQCILTRLPGGGPAAPLAGASTCSNPTGVTLHKSGRFKNVLLAQALTLALNIRYNTGLEAFELNHASYTTVGADGCVDPMVANGSSGGSFHIPTSVSTYLGANNTVGDLLALANLALGNALPSGAPSLGDIVDALAAINEGFNECQLIENGGSAMKLAAGNTDPVQIDVFPNPFEDFTTVQFKSVDDAQTKVQVIDLTGKVLTELYNDYAVGGVTYTLEVEASKLSAGTYIVRINSDGKSTYKRIVLVK